LNSLLFSLRINEIESGGWDVDPDMTDRFPS
jgi:hypothetical protein